MFAAKPATFKHWGETVHTRASYFLFAGCLGTILFPIVMSLNVWSKVCVTRSEGQNHATSHCLHIVWVWMSGPYKTFSQTVQRAYMLTTRSNLKRVLLKEHFWVGATFKIAEHFSSPTKLIDANFLAPGFLMWQCPKTIRHQAGQSNSQANSFTYFWCAFPRETDFGWKMSWCERQCPLCANCEE